MTALWVAYQACLLAIGVMWIKAGEPRIGWPVAVIGTVGIIVNVARMARWL